MSMTNEEAAAAIRAHHAELRQGLVDRVAAVEQSVRRGEWHAEAQRGVVDFLEGELLPHASAEERALYPAGEAGPTAMLVRSMRDEHGDLVSRVAALREATDAVTVASAASAILALFESHLHKENDLLIPALVTDPQVSLQDLLAGMHELVG